MRFPVNLRSLARILLLVSLVAVLAAGAGFFWLSRSGLPLRSGHAAIFELAAPVQVRFDTWGVPHVEAKTSRDLAMAIGWLHANDRLMQMELGRRAAAGRIAEIAGEDALPLDVAALDLRLYETAERIEQRLSVEHRGWLEAYALGVNSWLQRRPNGLPPECVALRIEPRPWRVADSLAIQLLLARELSYPARFEEQRWAWLRSAGIDRLNDLSDGAPLRLDGEVERFLRDHPRRSRPATPGEEPQKGSNNWALGATRTKSEAPLVANDPHLELAIPGTWYQALLRSPEYDVMGLTLPGLPLVVIGQNANLAWSFTNTELDNNDLFLEEPSPDGNSVRRGDRFVPLTVETVRIPVRGRSDVEHVLRRSDLGPYFPADATRDLPARSLVWTAHALFDPFDAFVGLARAESVDEVPALVADFICPVQNLIVADRRGGLLFTVMGALPERARGDGRLPLPAWDSANHWVGLRPANANPTLRAPKDDLLATANNDVRPEGYALPMPAEFDMDFRVQRIRERLAARVSWWPADCADVQADVVSLHARSLVSLLPESVEGEAGFARNSLIGWDGSMQLQGVAALYALVERELFRAIYSDELERFEMRALPGFGRGEALLRALDGRLPAIWFDDLRTAGRVETLADVVQTALTRAWREGSRRFGPDVSTWDYGALHRWTARHPLSALPFGKSLLERGPFAVPGSATTIAAFSGPWRGDAIEVRHGPSMRWVADTGDPDRSLCVLPTGQSGHPGDEHYADQIPVFLAGKTHSMHWSESAIAAATVSTLMLTP